MNRSIIRIPTATLLALLGEGHLNTSSFRRSRIERSWPCGCHAGYAYDRFDDADWTPCEKHAPRIEAIEANDVAGALIAAADHDAQHAVT
jgi:hypothetical protein